jgi:phage gpG-like protein
MYGAIELVTKVSRRAQLRLFMRQLEGAEIRVGVQGPAARTPHAVKRSRAARQRKGRGRGSDGRGRFLARPRAQPAATGGITMAELAAVHEFGSRNGRIPERSFLRRALLEYRPEIRREMRRVLEVVARGETPRKALARLAVRLEGFVKDTIDRLTSPRHAPSTLRKRLRETGDSTPKLLVDTGQLRNSITAIVTDARGGILGGSVSRMGGGR